VELTWTTLLLSIAAVGVAWFWADSLRVREVANCAAIAACTQMNLQFLDGTVAFARLRLIRDAGHLKLRRTYVFDYTAQSIDRLQGFVVLRDRLVETVGFARESAQTHSIAPTHSYPPTPTHPPAANEMPAKVLNLDEWRKARERHH